MTARYDGANGPIVGILGGMGPLATADFYTKLIAATPATDDHEHLRVAIWADPTIPDVGGSEAAPALVRGGQILAAMGAAFIAMPCNAAHAHLPRIQPEIPIPFLHMMDEAASAIELRFPLVERVGLLAATPTIDAGLYQERFARHHIEVAVPDDARQALVMQAIYHVKAGNTGAEATALVQEAAAYLVGQRAEILIAGCTELPLILRDGDATIPVLDATQTLAEATVRKAGRVPWTAGPSIAEALYDEA